MKCPHCDAEITEDLDECPFCHASFKSPAVAQHITHVGISAVDSYSIGHIAMGVMTFLILSFFYSIPTEFNIVPILEMWLIFLLSFVVAVVWEIFENTILWAMGKKFENRRDSILNALWDILFVMLGAVVFWIFWIAYVDIGGFAGRWYYVIGFVVFAILIVIFSISLKVIKKTSESKWIS